MLRLKKFFAAGIAVLTLSAVSATALAASAYASPAEAFAALTGKTVESVIEERQETGKTYGTLAQEAGVLDEFKSAVLELKKDRLDSMVAAGEMTREEADEILAALEANSAACDGTGGARIGQQAQAGFGSGSGLGNGLGLGSGSGQGAGAYKRGAGGAGSQMRLRDGTCG